MTRYEQGFMRKCAEYGVDGRALLGRLKGMRKKAGTHTIIHGFGKEDTGRLFNDNEDSAYIVPADAKEYDEHNWPHRNVEAFGLPDLTSTNSVTDIHGPSDTLPNGHTGNYSLPGGYASLTNSPNATIRAEVRVPPRKGFFGIGKKPASTKWIDEPVWRLNGVTRSSDSIPSYEPRNMYALIPWLHELLKTKIKREGNISTIR